MIDYILTAAVGISAGVGALISAVPSLQKHTLLICLAILLILTVINLRGVHDTGVAFMIPTYLFLGTLLIVIGVGLVKALASDGHPVVTPPKLPPATAVLSLWLILKVFSSGCTAMTGVEAVSNGVKAFREPATKVARLTLTIIIALLIILLAGIALLCHWYGIGATNPGAAGYQSVLSQLTAAVMGNGPFYWITIASILLVLSLSANTAFADFPRLTRAIALHDYLPHVFLVRGRRLLFSHGIAALVTFTGLLLILFGGVTDRLIPLYAIGAFLAFTLSQAGMVVHWIRAKGPAWQVRMLVNGFGAIATGVTLLVVLVAKFLDGAWITALLVPLMIFAMTLVKRHYVRVSREIACSNPLRVEGIKPPLVVIPLDRWSRLSEKALRFALSMSPEIIAVHVDSGHDEQSICDEWEQKVAEPLRSSGLPVPRLVNLMSPYRFVIAPVIDFVLEQEKSNENRQIAVLVPELVVKHWWENLLHNQRANLLKLMLLVKGNQRILVINIPWYLHRP
jgi:amino acid transporter